MIGSLLLSEFGQLGSLPLSGHGKVRRPISWLRTKMRIAPKIGSGGQVVDDNWLKI